MTGQYSNLPTISISGTEVERITFKGEPVVTFAMVDKIHQRPGGTARRAFNENRGRFVEADDFITLTQPNEIRSLGFTRPQGGTPASVTLITRRGYLKLVKPLGDDRAWEVQGEMIDRYFMVESVANHLVRLSKPAPAMLREARLQHKMFMGILKDCGIKGQQAAISANQATERMTGYNLMGALGITHMDAPTNEPDLTPSDIGLQLHMSARAVNLLLTRHGYHYPERDHKGRIFYEMTEKGRKAGGVFKDTGKRHGSGTPVKQLFWPSGIVGQLRSEMREAA